MGPNNQKPLLFRGNGDGTFDNVAAEVGLPTKDGTDELVALLEAGSTSRGGVPAVHEQTEAYYALLEELRGACADALDA